MWVYQAVGMELRVTQVVISRLWRKSDFFPKKIQPCLTQDSNPNPLGYKRNVISTILAGRYPPSYNAEYIRTGIRQLLPKKADRYSTKSVSSSLFSHWYDNFKHTMYKRLGLYARRPIRCVLHTATHYHLQLAWSRKQTLWTPQQWASVMFSDDSRFSLQSDSRRTFICRAPGTRYQQENIIEQHRFGGARLFVWERIILAFRTGMYVQIGTITGQFDRDLILKQHVRVFCGPMSAKFLFMDDNARPHRANIVNKCYQLEDITRMDWPAFSPNLNPVEHVWDMLG
ncbi:transposable element Tc1 transposase [Trichonephila clavipes]|nr:transposable element Tc1 transposase [Trichonephila clavipes]